MKKRILLLLSVISHLSADFKPEKLDYSYSALEPSISKEIMELHYDKHYKGYIQKLNFGLKGHEKYLEYTLRDLLKSLPTLPVTIKKVVQDNGGGAFNHALFWKCMHPHGQRKPIGKLLKVLEKTFGSYQSFQRQFDDAAHKLFGSGWVWLCADKKKQLKIVTTANQDCPLSEGFIPLLNLDLWEHAYYLQYYNKRSDYVQAWWGVVDWREAERLYDTL